MKEHGCTYSHQRCITLKLEQMDIPC